MTERYIWHVTLDTGHGRSSPRGEVADAAIRTVQGMISTGLRGPAPVLPGYHLTAAAVGSNLLATVNYEAATGIVPVATFGVARRSLGAARLWTMLHQAHAAGAPPLATDPADVPAAPWVAVRFEAGMGLDRDSPATWLGDFGRCLGWAWIELRDDG